MYYIDLIYFTIDTKRRSPELTDQMLQDLAEHISSYAELRALAINGLGLDAVKVQKNKENYPNDITTAAHKVLTEWYKSQKDRQNAYKELCTGLTKSNLDLYIGMVLKPKDKKFYLYSSNKKVKGGNTKTMKRLRRSKRKR